MERLLVTVVLWIAEKNFKFNHNKEETAIHKELVADSNTSFSELDLIVIKK